jgi:hypothetical protein
MFDTSERTIVPHQIAGRPLIYHKEWDCEVSRIVGHVLGDIEALASRV